MAGGLHPPLEVIASWPAPNYVDPQRRGWELVILCCVLYALALLAVVARLWARLAVQHNPGADDVLIVLAMIPTTAMTIAICLGSRLYGFDRHVWDVPLPTLKQSLKVTFTIEFTYIFSTTLTRVSILFFYRRMVSDSVSSGFLWAVRATIAFVVLYALAFMAVLLGGCRPFNAFWNEIDPSWVASHDFFCINEAANLFAAGIISMTQDFLTCGLPSILLWKLRIPRRQKIALGAIFGIGFFLCIVGVMRMYYVHFIYYQTYDVTWAVQNNWIWTAVEALLAIVCASAPALKVFVKQLTNFSGIGSGVYVNEGGPPGGYVGSHGVEVGSHSEKNSKTGTVSSEKGGFPAKSNSGSEMGSIPTSKYHVENVRYDRTDDPEIQLGDMSHHHLGGTTHGGKDEYGLFTTTGRQFNAGDQWRQEHPVPMAITTDVKEPLTSSRTLRSGPSLSSRDGREHRRNQNDLSMQNTATPLNGITVSKDISFNVETQGPKDHAITADSSSSSSLIAPIDDDAYTIDGDSRAGPRTMNSMEQLRHPTSLGSRVLPKETFYRP